jgi:hypothetical protein
LHKVVWTPQAAQPVCAMLVRWCSMPVVNPASIWDSVDPGVQHMECSTVVGWVPTGVQTHSDCSTVVAWVGPSLKDPACTRGPWAYGHSLPMHPSSPGWVLRQGMWVIKTSQLHLSCRVVSLPARALCSCAQLLRQPAMYWRASQQQVRTHVLGAGPGHWKQAVVHQVSFG